MGDRTYVTLYVKTSQAEAAAAVFGDIILDTPGYVVEYGKLTAWGFDEVNYGELPFLNKLREAGIAYDNTWDRGNDYGAGTESCRFTPEGEAILRTIYDDDLNPDIHELMARIDDPEALREFILQHKENTTTLPWDNQEEYGKTYQAMQLIISKQ